MNPGDVCYVHLISIWMEGNGMEGNGMEVLVFHVVMLKWLSITNIWY